MNLGAFNVALLTQERSGLEVRETGWSPQRISPAHKGLVPRLRRCLSPPLTADFDRERRARRRTRDSGLFRSSFRLLSERHLSSGHGHRFSLGRSCSYWLAELSGFPSAPPSYVPSGPLSWSYRSAASWRRSGRSFRPACWARSRTIALSKNRNSRPLAFRIACRCERTCSNSHAGSSYPIAPIGI